MTNKNNNEINFEHSGKDFLVLNLLKEGLLYVDFGSGTIYIRKSILDEFHPACVCPKFSGYMELKLCYRGKLYYYYVHRVVMMAALGVPLPHDMVVDHIDGNKQNNSLNNLELVTRIVNEKRKIDRMKQEGKKVRKLANDDQILRDMADGLKTIAMMEKYGYATPASLYTRMKKLRDRM